MKGNDAAAFRAGLDSKTRATMDRLRSIAIAADAALSERIRWNVPSFAIGDADRIILGVERRGGIRIAFQRSAKARPDGDFHLPIPKGAHACRRVIIHEDQAAIDRVKSPLIARCRRWIGHAVG